MQVGARPAQSTIGEWERGLRMRIGWKYVLVSIVLSFGINASADLPTGMWRGAAFGFCIGAALFAGSRLPRS